VFHESVSPHLLEDGRDPVGGVGSDVDLDVEPLGLQEDFDAFEAR